MMLPLLMVLPWVGLLVWLAVGVRLPRPLPPASAAPRPDRLVSVIVPARDEAHNIERVLGSLVRSEGVRFEVIVVDDRSSDDTASRARSVAPGLAERVEVIEGEPLPDGWFGKPWACRQGAQHARGELLLFTDADTVHGPHLLARAVAGLDEDGAGALTLAGRQLMESFWERVVQPQIFLGMLFRFPRQGPPLPPERWRDAIANGQYILLHRATYDAIGGHASVQGEVAEDLRLAQRLVRLGHRLVMRRAEDAFATRMYRSLGELVEGWSKNLILGGLATLAPGLLRRLTPPAAVVSGPVVWWTPLVVGAAAWAGWLGPAWALWAAATTAVSLVFWVAVTVRFGAPARYALLYPLGVAVASWIFLRAWRRGTRVRWKGRDYRVDPVDDDEPALHGA